MGHTRVDYALLTNTKFWDGLNDETRTIIEKGVEEATKVARDSAMDLNDDALKTLKDRGQVEIHELSESEIDAFKKKLEPVYKEWAEKIGADIIKDAESKSK
jgi:C4-dicarboxylate-binding protein DctP